jgi:hypothetical protein
LRERNRREAAAIRARPDHAARSCGPQRPPTILRCGACGNKLLPGTSAMKPSCRAPPSRRCSLMTAPHGVVQSASLRPLAIGWSGLYGPNIRSLAIAEAPIERGSSS